MTTEALASTRHWLDGNYLKLWASSAAANLADGIFVVALPLMAERRLGRSNVLFLSIIAMAVGLLVPALTSSPPLIMASAVLSGLFIMMWNIITVTLRQRIVPEQLLGRANAGYRFVASGTMPIGALLGGLIAEAFGVVAVFALGGLATLSLLGFRVILDDSTLDAAERVATPVAT